jgi:pimeloyl-ACP methyl ester carboxylesterase
VASVTAFPSVAVRRCLPGALLVLLCSTGSIVAGGVTIITHGFASDVNSWIIPMAGEVPVYSSFPGATYSCYQISITRNGSGQYVYAATFLGGTPPLLTDSGELLVKLDWSTLSSLGGPSTTTIASTSVNALLDPNLIPALGGRPLAQLPLHLVGHSRGGSVITEMARFLGAQGIWVDQVTSLGSASRLHPGRRGRDELGKRALRGQLLAESR